MTLRAAVLTLVGERPSDPDEHITCRVEQCALGIEGPFLRTYDRERDDVIDYWPLHRVKRLRVREISEQDRKGKE